jgi:glycosyltransferase involved in cell wall biosynthesis
MAENEKSELAGLIERLERIESRLARTEETTNAIYELAYRQARRRWREKFRPTLWQFRQHPPRALNVPSAYKAQAPPANAPRIAIVTPSLNQGRYVQATIDSVLAQNYPNLAYFVSDGASTDSTVNLLESCADKFLWRSAADTGQANAINRGFAEVDGEIMAFLNSDDMLLPGTLAYVACAFLADPDIDVVYGHSINIDEDEREIGRRMLPPHDPETIKWIDYIPQETMFWRRRVWDKIGPMDETFHFALDWDFILRAHAAGFRFKRLPRFLACFRVHDQQKSNTMLATHNEETRRLREVHLKRDPAGREIRFAIRGYLRRHVVVHRLYKAGLLRY